MSVTTDNIELTKNLKERATRYGFDLVGVISAKTLDDVPSHYIAHRDYETWTKKTTDYMEDAKSVIILGARVWDDLHDLVIRVQDHHEYPDEWRGRLYARRLVRYLNREGYKTVLEADLLSKKRMAELAGLGHYGKNSLIINPILGPWVRYRSIVTDAPLAPDNETCVDLCGECDECVKACPVGALTPYVVDPDRCLLGMPMEERVSKEFRDVYTEHSPMVTENTWRMCQACQRACPIGRDLRNRHIGRGSGEVDERI